MALKNKTALPECGTQLSVLRVRGSPTDQVLRPLDNDNTKVGVLQDVYNRTRKLIVKEFV